MGSLIEYTAQLEMEITRLRAENEELKRMLEITTAALQKELSGRMDGTDYHVFGEE